MNAVVGIALDQYTQQLYSPCFSKNNEIFISRELYGVGVCLFAFGRKAERIAARVCNEG